MCRREKEDSAALTIQTLWKMIKAQKILKLLKQRKFVHLIDRYLSAAKFTIKLRKLH